MQPALTAEVVMVFYSCLGSVATILAICLVRSPVLRAMLRGQGTDPSKFGSWQDHLDDIGLGPSWRSDGYGGVRETKVESLHTRRRR